MLLFYLFLYISLSGHPGGFLDDSWGTPHSPTPFVEEGLINTAPFAARHNLHHQIIKLIHRYRGTISLSRGLLRVRASSGFPHRSHWSTSSPRPCWGSFTHLICIMFGSGIFLTVGIDVPSGQGRWRGYLWILFLPSSKSPLKWWEGSRLAISPFQLQRILPLKFELTKAC